MSLLPMSDDEHNDDNDDDHDYDDDDNDDVDNDNNDRWWDAVIN